MKKCYRCKEVKKLNCFSKHIRMKDGLRNSCKDCDKLSKKDYLSKPENRKKNNNYCKQYRVDNIEYFRAYDKARNPAKRKAYQENEEIRLQKKQYRLEHKDQIRKYHQKYQKDRSETDINYKLIRRLRTRIHMAIRKGYKSGSAIKDLGCSISEFKTYIESKFYNHPITNEVMSWDNYGKKGWHFDHIVPLSSFDLTNREQFIKAVHYTNLQPMWAFENMSKGAKLIT